MKKVKVINELDRGLEKQRQKMEKNYMMRVKKDKRILCGRKDQNTSKGSQK